MFCDEEKLMMNKRIGVLIVTAGVALLSACTTVEHSAPTAWEYKVFDHSAHTHSGGIVQVEPELNRLAEEGWSVVSSSVSTSGVGGRLIVILKRPRDP